MAQAVNVVSQHEFSSWAKRNILSYALQKTRQTVLKAMADEKRTGPLVMWIEPTDAEYVLIRAAFPIMGDAEGPILDEWLEKQRRRIAAANGWIPKW